MYVRTVEIVETYSHPDMIFSSLMRRTHRYPLAANFVSDDNDNGGGGSGGCSGGGSGWCGGGAGITVVGSPF